MNNQGQFLDISWSSIFKIFFVGFLFYAAYLVREIIVLFIFALIVSILVNPAINFLKRLRIPRVIGTIFVYLSIFGVLGLIIYLTAPIFIFELQQFSRSLPQYFQDIHPFLKGLGIEIQGNLQEVVRELAGGLEQISAGIFSALSFVFGGVFSTILILATAFFLSLEEKGVERFLTLLSPKRHEEYVARLFRRCQKKVSGWFGSRLLISIFVGLATFLMLLLFDVKYAFMLALMGGLLNFVPYIGPLAAGILMLIFIGATDLWWKAGFSVVGYILIQQIDAYVLTPVLTSKFVGLPPAIILLSLVIGGKLFGILGAIFAIPVAGILYEFFKEFLERKKREQEDAQIL